MLWVLSEKIWDNSSSYIFHDSYCRWSLHFLSLHFQYTHCFCVFNLGQLNLFLSFIYNHYVNRSCFLMALLTIGSYLFLFSWFLAKSYDAFMASDSLIKQIPRILGPGLNKAGKFPTPITHNDNMVQKVEELRSTIKFQMKKVGLHQSCGTRFKLFCRKIIPTFVAVD